MTRPAAHGRVPRRTPRRLRCIRRVAVDPRPSGCSNVAKVLPSARMASAGHARARPYRGSGWITKWSVAIAVGAGRVWVMFRLSPSLLPPKWGCTARASHEWCDGGYCGARCVTGQEDGDDHGAVCRCRPGGGGRRRPTICGGAGAATHVPTPGAPNCQGQLVAISNHAGGAYGASANPDASAGPGYFLGASTHPEMVAYTVEVCTIGSLP
jgi:hypothetical protein